MTRQKKYFTEEERMKAYHQSKNKYMLKKEWCCSDCGNKNNTLAGKWSHLKTQKHIINEFKNKVDSL